jgi:hypothetical protein
MAVGDGEDDSPFEEDAFDQFPTDKFQDDGFDESNGIANDASVGNQSTANNIRGELDPNAVQKGPKPMVTEAEIIKRHGLVQYCVALGITNAMSGAVVGGVLGAFNGAVEGRQLGLTMRTGFVPHMLRSGAANAISFGGFLGSYTAIKKYMRFTRLKDDPINAFTAGCVAGAVGSLRTRSVPAIAVSALGSGVLMAVVDSFL